MTSEIGKLLAAEAQRGFEDGTESIITPENLARPVGDFYKPPASLDGCEECAKDGYGNDDCPRCVYTEEFVEATGK